MLQSIVAISIGAAVGALLRWLLASLMDGRIAWSLGVVAVHGIGSVAMTLLGIGTVVLLRPALQRRLQMNGYQVTFFTQQDRHHDGKQVHEWLVAAAKDVGVRGSTVVMGAEGTDHTGERHSFRFFELADQPIKVTMARRWGRRRLYSPVLRLRRSTSSMSRHRWSLAP